MSPDANTDAGTAPARVRLVARASGSLELVGVWFYKGTTLLGQGSGVNGGDFTFDWADVPAGTHTITATAKASSPDCPQAIRSVDRSFQVSAPNQAPAVSLTQPTNGGVFQGDSASLTLLASASDADGTVARVEFLSGNTVIASVNSSPYQYTWSSVPPGTYSIRARATDNDGDQTTSAPASIVVNAQPRASMTAPANGAVFNGPTADIPMVASASDSDDSVQKVEFMANGKVIATRSAPPYSFTWSDVGTGAHSLAARATDTRGGVTTSTHISVRVNELPTVSVSSNAQTGTAPASFTLSATANDADGSITKVEFLANGSVIGSKTAAPYSLVWSNVAAGTYSVAARATDNNGQATTSAALVITVSPASNVPPSVTLTSPSANTVFDGPLASIPLKASASDSDGTVAKVEFLADGQVVGTRTSPPYTLTWANVEPGHYSIVARATDNQGATKTTTAITVRVNALPTVTVNANATTGKALASFTLSATAGDPDGSIAKVEFLANGALIGTRTTTPYSIAWTDVPAGRYAVTARATDNNGQQKNSAAKNITVDESVPPLPTVDITPPNLVGAVAGSLAARLGVNAKGAATFSTALALPPGTAGMTPSVGLAYDSHGPEGGLGRGWSITGLSSITRCGTTLATDGVRRAVTLGTDDEFCLDGQRLMLVSGTRHGTATYRTETDHFAWVRSTAGADTANGPQSWEVRTRDGLIHTYGTTTDSRVEASGSTVVLTWVLARTKDRRGNYIDYLYDENNSTGEHSIRQIRYTGNAGASPVLVPYHAVNFIYESRVDPWRGWIRGSQVQRRQRLASIQAVLNTNAQGGGGSLAREWRISYTPSPTSGRSLVSAVSDCAGDGTCLPDTTFAWSQRDPAGNTHRAPGSGDWGGPSGITFSKDLKTYGSNTQQLRTKVLPVDLNGDGRADLLYGAGSGAWRACLSQPEHRFACSDWSGPAAKSEDAVAGDFNGDGRTDLAIAPDTGNGTEATWQICQSTGSGLSCAEQRLRSYGRTPGRYQVGDFNGDGLDDILVVNLDAAESAWLCRSTGNSFAACTAFNAGPAFVNDPEVHPPMARVFRPMADFDGDGRIDLLQYQTRDSISGVFYLKRTTDDGLSPAGGGESIAPYFGNVQGRSALADSNGDVIEPYVDVHNGADDPNGSRSEVCHYTGMTFVCSVQSHQDKAGTLFDVRDFDGDGRVDALNNIGKTMSQLRPDGTLGTKTPWDTAFPASTLSIAADFNGDGVTDQASYDPETGRWTVYLDGFGGNPDLLSSVTDGNGLVTRFEHRPLHDTSVYTLGAATAYPKRNLTGGQPVVGLVRKDNGQGGWLETAYRYAGLRSDARGRGSLGFETVTQEDRSSRVTTVTRYSQDWPHTGMVLDTQATHANGVVLSQTSQVLAVLRPSDKTVHPYIASSSTSRRDLDGSDVAQTTSAIDAGGIDAHGNVTARTETATANADTYITRTRTEYLNDDTSKLWGLPTRVAVTKSAPGAVDVTRTVAKTYVSGTPLPDTETIEPDDPAYRVVTTYQRDASFGVVTKKSLRWVDPADGASKVRDVEILAPYDDRRRWPLTVTNALGHAEHKTFDDASGQPLSATDANALTTLWRYDGWGRKQSETRADGTSTTWAHRQCTNACSNGASTVEITQHWARVDGVSRQTAVPVEVFHDRLNRKVLTRTWSAAAESVYSDRLFDALGRLQQVSHRHTQAQRDSGALVWTTLLSDDLGRPVQVDTPKAGGSGVNTSHIEYKGTSTVRRRPWRQGLDERQSRTEQRNALGLLASVTDETGRTTRYAYEPFGGLARTTDPLGNQIEVLYDRLGRKTRLSDPDLGVVVYQVDPLGQTWRQTDAKQQRSTSQYDALGRLTQRLEPDLTSTWVYDSAANGIGKLAEVYTGPIVSKDYRRVHAYDALGRPSRETITIAGEWDYTTASHYDAFGRSARQDHSRNAVGGSGGPQVSWLLGYNNQGSLSRVERALAGGASEPVWALSRQDIEGRVVEEDLLQSGLKTLRGFNRYTGELESLQVGPGGGPGIISSPVVQNDRYQRDEVGNLSWREQLGADGSLVSEAFA
ncbi:MAG: VCBS repeat-containing protein, partial [Burkholderiales bacterium]|nr:VCBS repeat-containing protein [Burkholderiales bacterium]